MAKDGGKSDIVSKEQKEASLSNASRLRSLISGLKSDPSPRSPHELAERGAARGRKETAKKGKNEGKKTGDDC